ncbi:MAG: hypothetical protein ABI693_34680 [Bryobacteraceae bacterium]
MKPLVAVLAASILTLALAIACSPSFPKAVFTFARHPDFPRTRYLAGELGILQPTYARSYLVIAYRYLQDHPLSADERQQVREYWKDRQTGQWDNTATDWPGKWEKIRHKVPSAVPHAPNPVTGDRYAYAPPTNDFFLNCADDAYQTAVLTLRERAARFGYQSAALRSWRDAQDMVFHNCDGKTPAIPPPAGQALPPLLRSDRAYQIAAAHFYAGQHNEAVAAFRAIATDASSPWQWIAPYLVVRTLARAAVDGRSKDLAEKAARDLLASRDPRLHAMTTVLLRRVILKQRDEGYFHELSQHGLRQLRSRLAGGTLGLHQSLRRLYPLPFAGSAVRRLERLDSYLPVSRQQLLRPRAGTLAADPQ